MEVSIREALEAACTKLGLPVPDGGVAVEHPDDLSHGDFATNIALVLAKEADKAPREVAEELLAAWEQPEVVEHVEVAGPGFINMHLTRIALRDGIRTVCAVGERWGAHDTLKGQKVLVEHTQPNPFKPFHIGHLMTSTLGESIARLYEFSGAEVRRANYQGDVGLHVAKCLWGLNKLGGDPSSLEDLGKAYVEGNRAYEDEDGAKAEIAQYNAMVYEGAAHIQEQYTTGRRVSLEHFEDLYTLLGTHFDHYFFESETQAPGRAMVKEGLAEGVFEESDGAVVYKGEDDGLHTRVFISSQGLPTYEAKELGLAQLKAEKWDFDLSITTAAVEQQEYFKVIFAVLHKLRPELAEKLAHVSHGMMVLSDGKMSSRKGNVITGEALLTEMQERAAQKVAERDLTDDEKEEITKAVAIAAIKYSILKQKAGKNITFDKEKSLSFEGDSGPYLQYAHTRAMSVLAKAQAAGIEPSTELAPKEVVTLERLVYRFPEVALRACKEHEPHFVTTFLVELASEWNSWYAAEKILDGSLETPYKLAVAEAVAKTLKNGLWLLGMQAPEKM